MAIDLLLSRLAALLPQLEFYYLDVTSNADLSVDEDDSNAAVTGTKARNKARGKPAGSPVGGGYLTPLDEEVLSKRLSLERLLKEVDRRKDFLLVCCNSVETKRELEQRVFSKPSFSLNPSFLFQGAPRKEEDPSETQPWFRVVCDQELAEIPSLFGAVSRGKHSGESSLECYSVDDVVKFHLVHFSLPYLDPSDPIDLHLGRKSRKMDFHRYLARHQLLVSAFPKASPRAIHLIPDSSRKFYEDMVQAVGRLCVAVQEQKEMYLDAGHVFQPQSFKSILPSVSRLCVRDMHDIQLMSKFKMQMDSLKKEVAVKGGQEDVAGLHSKEDDPFL